MVTQCQAQNTVLGMICSPTLICTLHFRASHHERTTTDVSKDTTKPAINSTSASGAKTNATLCTIILGWVYSHCVQDAAQRQQSWSPGHVAATRLPYMVLYHNTPCRWSGEEFLTGNNNAECLASRLTGPSILPGPLHRSKRSCSSARDSRFCASFRAPGGGVVLRTFRNRALTVTNSGTCTGQ